MLRNGWFMMGLAAYGGNVLTWLFVLRPIPLSVAAPFVALVYVLVPLASPLPLCGRGQPANAARGSCSSCSA
ncbi:MAG TPA: hypothetical protein VF395_18285 [Polyangiaceae bacterium]